VLYHIAFKFKMYFVELKEFCAKLWKAKEEKLCNFYTKQVNFSTEADGLENFGNSTIRTIGQLFALSVWIPFTIYSIYLTSTSYLVLAYVTTCIVGLILCSRHLGGFDMLQLHSVV